MDDDEPHVGVREPLANREFRGIILAQVVSEAGDQIARVAIALLILAHTGSALLSAATFAVSFIPTFLGAALLGPLADRFSRRNLMLIADVGRAVVIGLMAIVAIPGTPVWLLFALLLAAEFFTPLFDSARAASIPDILGDRDLVTAGLGLSRSLHLINQAVGLIVGGFLVQLTSPRIALLVDAASFFISFVLLAVFLHNRPATLESPEGVQVLLHDLREGWQLLVADVSRRSLILLGWGMALAIVAPEAVALAYVRDQGWGDAWGGILMASVIVGAAMGSLFVAGRPVSRQIDLLLPLAIAVCLPLLVTGLEPPRLVLVVLWLLSGCAQAFLVPIMAFTTMLTINEHRGRVVGIASAGFAALCALGYLITGAISDATSPAFAVVVMAAIGLAVAAVAFIVWPAHRLRADLANLDSQFPG
jgi:MFS family permease